MLTRILSCAALLTTSLPAFAQDEPAPEAPVSPFHASGFVDSYVLVNFNHPRVSETACPTPCQENGLRAFDVRANELALSLAELAIWVDPQPVGVRLDLDFGPTTDIVHAADPATPEVVKHVQQAYGTAEFDVGPGLTLDVGKFVTIAGQEVIETRDNWNYSRSLLFTWAIPFYHFGARVTVPFTSAVTGSLLVVNGWNNVVDRNDGKTLGLQLVLKPSERFTGSLNYLVGPEQVSSNSNYRHMVDLVALVTPIDPLQLGVNVDLGYEPNAVAGEDVSWMGAALTARYAVREWLALAARGEWYRDEDGFTTGVSQTLLEGTLTLEASYQENLIARLEYRHDQSTDHVFAHEQTLVRGYQDTLTVGTVFGF